MPLFFITVQLALFAPMQALHSLQLVVILLMPFSLSSKRSVPPIHAVSSRSDAGTSHIFVAL